MAVVPMNKQPVSYLQTDPRWKNVDYSTTGETTTIGGSGCGPTSAAMLIETLTGQNFTPVDACAWALSHGYKALNQGTYHSYFVPQFAANNITCKRLNTSSIGGNVSSPVHDQALVLLKEGWYLIALMGKGLWTSSGHYIVVWWEDGKIRINDPASTKATRLTGDPATFRAQCKYYWAIDARTYNQEDDEMLSYEQWKEYQAKYDAEKSAESPASWSDEERAWAEQNNLILGDETGNKKYKGAVTREQLVVFLYRFYKLICNLFGKSE